MERDSFGRQSVNPPFLLTEQLEGAHRPFPDPTADGCALNNGQEIRQMPVRTIPVVGVTTGSPVVMGRV